MKRLSGLVLLSRAAAVSGRFIQAAAPLHSSITATSNSNPSVEPNLISAGQGKRSVAGKAFLFSASAASRLSEDAARVEPSPVKVVPNDVVLYQYEACPFCNKVKAFLDYYDIPYKIVEVNPMSKKEIKWSDYKKVPILMVDGEQMVDSTEIINKLFRKIHPDISTGPASADEEEKKWLGWVDNHLVHVLSPNIYRTASEALESFDYIATHGNFSLTERIFAKYAGATAMYFVSKKLKKRHNITDERKALYEAAETWVDALKGRDYLGGPKPNLADLSVFGVLRPIRHLKSGRDMVENTRIGNWYKKIESAVGESSKVKA